MHLSYWWDFDLWEFFLGYNSIEKNYNPAAGFVIIKDVKDCSGIFRKSFSPNKYGVRKVNFSGTQSTNCLTKSLLVDNMANALAKIDIFWPMHWPK